MAYGTAAGVGVRLGGATTGTHFTTANITLAITDADYIVDTINSAAGANAKTAASNILAAEILLQGGANDSLQGLSSDAGTSGRPGKSGKVNAYEIPKIVYQILAAKVRTSFDEQTPDSTGGW